MHAQRALKSLKTAQVSVWSSFSKDCLVFQDNHHDLCYTVSKVLTVYQPNSMTGNTLAFKSGHSRE